MLNVLLPTIAQGLLWSLLALGVYITFRVLDIADLSVEGTFPLGAAVAATCITAGHPLWVAFALAIAAGCAAGAVTGLLTTKLRIPALLAGILTMIGLYSVNLRVMGRANISLLGYDTVYSWGTGAGLTEVQATLAVGLAAAAVVVGAVYWFFGTEIGLALRATGFNPQMSRAQGVNTDTMVILGLLVSNGLVAQSGGFADAGMGIGTIVIGLASVIIGEVLFGTRSFKNCLVSVILGSIVYRLVIAIVLEMGMPPNDLKLFTAILVALALSLPLIQKKYKELSHRRAA